MGRSPCCDKSNVKRGPWSPEEDALLKAYIDSHGHGGNWISLPTKAGLRRCGKSCRLRWLNYLRPDIKHGGFTEDEDRTICSLYNKLGSRWSIITSHLPGRTDNDVKNYWNTKLKKKLIATKQQPNLPSNQTNAPHTHTPTTTTTSVPPAPQRLSVIKEEVFGNVEELTKPLHPNYAINNGPYEYLPQEKPYQVMVLSGNRQVVVSPPVSDEVSAASSSVSVENGSNFVNWNTPDDGFFGELSEFFSAYGDAMPCYYPNFINVSSIASETKPQGMVYKSVRNS